MFTKELRKNQTDAEKTLWNTLRNRQLNRFKFRRQVSLGRYIVDFVCFESRLIVEVDGGQHADAVPYDETRTRWLGSQGFRVIRFWNNDVLMNLEGVWDRIVEECGHTPHPNPLPQGERE
jgi:adenine-specific DNA-methyltransferase